MSFTYIAKKACGCLSMACVDNPEHKREVAKEVAKALRLGEVVERIPTEQVRAMDWICTRHKSLQAELKEGG